MKSAASQQATLKRLEKFSYITDSSIGIPFTKFNLGVEPLIGILPGIGDLAGLFLSSYVLLEAHRLGASKRIKVKIITNILIDFFVGLIPIFGDIFDMFFKANVRNTRILTRYIKES
jgi:hypothetical protein